MKLVRFGPPGRERPGVWMGDGRILDVRAGAFHIRDYDTHFFSRFGLMQLRALCAEPGARFVAAETVRLGPPVARPSKIVCVGMNYRAHAEEFGARQPDEPVLFAKAPSSLIGPNDPVVLPPAAEEVDSEVELAVVIGRKISALPRSGAWSAVAGLTVLNDVTDRAGQRRAGQWFRAKSYDTFCPLGPFLVTPDEIKDPQSLRLRQTLDGEILQDARVGEMIFSVPDLIAFVSAGMTLYPGDIISTGTPPGIGSSRHPPRLMHPGSIVEAEIEGLGVQRNAVVSAQ